MDVVAERTLALFDFIHLLANDSAYVGRPLRSTTIENVRAAIQQARADMTTDQMGQHERVRILKHSETQRTTVVFDLGGVLIDWNPRHLYRKLFPEGEVEMERFLAEVCTSEWNLQQDAGRSWAEATALLKEQHPSQGELIEAFRGRWLEMIAGPIESTVQILRELKAAKTPLYALTNWSHETFPLAFERFQFLGWFDGIVVSGQERLTKPDPRIYHVLVERHGLRPAEIVFVDDNATNAEAATALGMHGLHFVSADRLRNELVVLGLPLRPQ